MSHIKPAQKQCVSWRHEIVVVRSSSICEEELSKNPLVNSWPTGYQCNRLPTAKRQATNTNSSSQLLIIHCILSNSTKNTRNVVCILKVSGWTSDSRDFLLRKKAFGYHYYYYFHCCSSTDQLVISMQSRWSLLLHTAHQKQRHLSMIKLELEVCIKIIEITTVVFRLFVLTRSSSTPLTGIQ